MVSFTHTDSINNDKTKITSKIINKLSTACQLHQGDKELNICINCSVAFCEQCASDHKTHKTINKNDLTKYTEELNQIKQNIDNNFTMLNIVGSHMDTDICKSERNELTTLIDKLSEVTENIRKKSKYVYSEFKNDFDNVFPYLTEYKEKVENLYEEAQKATTIRIEKNFIDFFFKYMNIKNHTSKVNDSLFVLKYKIENYKDLLCELKEKVKHMNSLLCEEYNQIKELKYKSNDDMVLNTDIKMSPRLKYSTINSNNNEDKKMMMSDIKSNHLSTNSNIARMNLKTLLSPPKDKKAIAKVIEEQYKERRSTNYSGSPRLSHNEITNIRLYPNNNYEQIPENTEEEDKQHNIISNRDNEHNDLTDTIDMNNLYNIEIKTSNLICFNINDNKISKINIDLSKTLIKKFEAFHSILNYKGIFYISGGYSTGKMFYKYNKQSNIFIPLKDMPTKHSYHCLLGVNESIFAISGYKTKKVEKYTKTSNQWEVFPELEYSRSWPSCININEKYIFVFGGLIDSVENSGDNTARIVEKMEVNHMQMPVTNKWEILQVNSEVDLPFYFGVLPIDNEKVLLIGGKYDPREDNICTCFSYSYETNSVVIDEEFKLPMKDEFNGRMFNKINDGIYGMFSAIYNDCFYIVNTSTKEIDIIKSNIQDNSSMPS